MVFKDKIIETPKIPQGLSDAGQPVDKTGIEGKATGKFKKVLKGTGKTASTKRCYPTVA